MKNNDGKKEGNRWINKYWRQKKEEKRFSRKWIKKERQKRKRGKEIIIVKKRGKNKQSK